MCGVVGYYCKKGKGFDMNEIKAMVSHVSHRGPDAEGFFQDDLVGLGHRRLSILDLSSSANQPFYSSSGRYVAVYNGEVFNAFELVEKYNIRLKTTSDTEAIVELFDRMGPSMANLLNGMFVILIYDLHDKQLHVFRDRIGIKPLYYFEDENYFIFGSELKVLNSLSYIKEQLRIDPRSICTFLHLGFIPGPHTIFKQVSKFPAGCYMKIDQAGVTLNKFWSLEEKISKKVIADYKSAKASLKELLESSVNYRLISDVPVGVFLSGGIDSSLVAAIAARNSSKPIKSFTVGLKDVNMDESEYARAVADYLGTEHHELILSEKDIINSWDNLLDAYDEPFGDSSCFPVYFLSKLAKQKVSVVLSGEGSDELFMGYGAYQWAKRLGMPGVHAIRNILTTGLASGSSRMKRAGRIFDYGDRSKIRSHIFSQEQYLFSEEELRGLLSFPLCEVYETEQSYNELNRVLSPREGQALFDLKYYLKDDLLHKVDIASMLCSLEVRVPFLDYRIVEFALNLSEHLKVYKGNKKFLLKEILYEYIPREYFDRPKKGFSIPLSKWLKSDLRFLLEENLSKEKIEQTGIFNYHYVKEIERRFLSGKENYLVNRLYVVLVIQRWLLKRSRQIEKHNF